MRRAAFLAWVLLAGGACAPPTCSDHGERALERDVDLVVRSDGRPGRDAADRLAGQGARAVVYLETGLYTAGPSGRQRIARALAATHSRDAVPVLTHMAARDPDPSVRESAQAALMSLTPQD